MSLFSVVLYFYNKKQGTPIMRNTLFPLDEAEKTFDYKKFEKDYFDLKSWGMQTSIDLKKCNPKITKSYNHLKQYLFDLCDIIEMTRFGEPTIITFGEADNVLGYSMTQFIETSLISGHFALAKKFDTLKRSPQMTSTPIVL